MMQFGFMKQR